MLHSNIQFLSNTFNIDFVRNYRQTANLSTLNKNSRWQMTAQTNATHDDWSKTSFLLACLGINNKSWDLFVNSAGDLYHKVIISTYFKLNTYHLF